MCSEKGWVSNADQWLPRQAGMRAAPLLTALALLLAAMLGACATPERQPASPMRANFPDPFLLDAGEVVYAYATNGGEPFVNVQVARSRDLQNWTLLSGHDAFPELPGWAKRGRTWAPEVLRVGDRYLLYFTALHRTRDRQCVGVAESRHPLGPFVSRAPAPFVCQYALGGSIDASPFRDRDGRIYLLFKNDGNRPDTRLPTRIYAQPLTPDGAATAGPPRVLAQNDTAWEGGIVEAPTMVRRGDDYLLFYSGSGYDRRPGAPSPYGMGYARCRTPLGPCTDAPGNPLLRSGMRLGAACLDGPGHQALLERGGTTWLAFHSWHATAECRPRARERRLHMARLRWTGGEPAVEPVPR